MLCDSLYYTLSCWKEVLKISCMCFFICCSKLWAYSYLFAQKSKQQSKEMFLVREMEGERERERERKRKREIERLVAINTEERLRG